MKATNQDDLFPPTRNLWKPTVTAAKWLSGEDGTQVKILQSRFFSLREAAKKKTVFFWEISPKSVYPPTHPRVFVRFGSTKGEIRVKKGDFRGNLGGF